MYFIYMFEFFWITNFIQIIAWTSYQKYADKTPYERSDRKLNKKYPEAFELQKSKLEKRT